MSLDSEVYALRLRVEMLRRDVFDLRDTTVNEARIAELQTAEAELRQREEAVAPKPHPRQGVLVDTSEAGRKDDFLMGPETTQLEVQVKQRLAQVPLGIVHLMDPAKDPLVSFTLKVSTDRQMARLRVTSYVEGYSARAVDTVELVDTREATLQQLPTFFPERVRQVTEQTRATLHVEIEDLDGREGAPGPRTELHRSFPLWLLPPTTAALAVRDPATRAWVDTARYFGAWVTPNAPEVLRVVRKAAGENPSGIASYQVTPEQVRAQVRALFNALKAEGITYVNSVLASGDSAEAFLQRVRLPREAIATRSANCIDGAVLFASLLEACSLFAALVIIPRHAFVAWKPTRTPEATNDWCFLETTQIGSADFETACATGTQRAAQYATQLKLLSLRALREQGIVPME